MTSRIGLAIVVAALCCGCDDRPQRTPPQRRPEPAPERPAPAKQPQPAAALPDLVIVGERLEPGSMVAAGTECRFHIDVRNRGSAAITGFVPVGAPGNVNGGFAGLQPGETKTATVVFPVHSRGATYRLKLSVDPENIYRESNEANNTTSEFVIQTFP